MSSSNPLPDSIWQAVLRRADTFPVWLVGGAVRDAFLDHSTFDADFAVKGEARRLARAVANEFSGDYYDLDRERGSGRVLIVLGGSERWVLDFTVVRGVSIEDDLRLRDFTMNALALSLEDPERLIDPCGGLQDIRAKIIRACTDQAIDDDPIRALRAVRLATDLGFRIAPETLRLLIPAAESLSKVSPERIRDELLHILAGKKPASAFRSLDHLGLLRVILPEVTALHGVAQSPPHAYDAFEHSLAVLNHLERLLSVLGPNHDPEGASDMTLAQVSLRLGRYRTELDAHLKSSLTSGTLVRQLLLLSALFHDAGKALTQEIGEDDRIHFTDHEEQGAELVRARARDLRFGVQECERLDHIVRYHHWPGALEKADHLTRRMIYRFFHRTGEAGIDVVLLSLADRLGMYVPPVPQEVWERRVELGRALLEARFDGGWLEPPRLMRGDELAAILGVEHGPQLGRLLEAIREAQAVGEVQTPEQAVALARGIRDGTVGSMAVDDDDPANANTSWDR